MYIDGRPTVTEFDRVGDQTQEVVREVLAVGDDGRADVRGLTTIKDIW